MFEIIFAQIFSCCQTWPFHIKDDPLKNQTYLGVFGCVGCSEFVPRHIPSENMFFVNQAFEEKCQDLKTKRKCLTETPFTTKHIKDMYIFLCEKLFVSIIVVSISVKPLKSSRAKAIIHWISSLGALSDIFSPPYRILICTMEVK